MIKSKQKYIYIYLYYDAQKDTQLKKSIKNKSIKKRNN